MPDSLRQVLIPLAIAASALAWTLVAVVITTGADRVWLALSIVFASMAPAGLVWAMRAKGGGEPFGLSEKE
jgi:hypothetical protein